MKKLIILLSFFISFAANAQKVIRITLPKSVTADAYSKSQTDSISTTLRNEITVAANGGVTLSQLDSANNVTKAQIPSNLSQLTNDPGYITASNISGKVNYTDTAAALLPYLRKIDTTGKWISPAVANATYATISNLNLKANDNNVIHQTGNEIISGTKSFTAQETQFGNGSNPLMGLSYGGRAMINMFLHSSTGYGGFGFNAWYDGAKNKWETLTNGWGGVGNVLLLAPSTGLDFSTINVDSTKSPRFLVSPSGIMSLPVTPNDGAGSFLTRQSTDGSITKRTPSEVLTDIGAQPLEDQRLSTTSNVKFNTAQVLNFSILTSGGAGTYFANNPQRVSGAATLYLPRYASDTLATKSELAKKLDSSYRDTWGTIDPFVSDSVAKTLGLRQSFVDSLRSAGFTKKVFGMSLSGTTPTFSTDVYVQNYGGTNTIDGTGITIDRSASHVINSQAGGTMTYDADSHVFYNHLATITYATLDTTIGFNVLTGKIYSKGNEVALKSDGYVTLANSQTITGAKTWTSPLTYTDGTNQSIIDQYGLHFSRATSYIDNSASDGTLRFNADNVVIGNANGTGKTYLVADSTDGVNFPLNTYTRGVATFDSTIHTKGFSTNYVYQNVNYTLNEKDYTVNANGAITITLPDATIDAGKIYNIVHTGTGTATINTTSSQIFENITGSPTTLTMTAIGTYSIQSTGSSWVVISKL